MNYIAVLRYILYIVFAQFARGFKKVFLLFYIWTKSIGWDGQIVNFQKGRILHLIFSKKCDIIPLGKSHKSLEMQKNLVQNSGTRWYFSCTVYIFSADDIFRKVAENPEKSTILANILRYLQIYIPAGPHWGGRGRTFKSCHSDQINPIGIRLSDLFFS